MKSIVTVIAAILVAGTPPAVAAPRKAARPAATKTSAAKPKKAEPAPTAMQALAPPPPEGPADAPAVAADDAPTTGDAPGMYRGGSRPTASAAVIPLTATQAACAGSQGQNVAIPDGTGSQTTRCGVNATLGRVDARVDYRVKPIAPH